MKREVNVTPAKGAPRLNEFRPAVAISLGALVLDILARSWSDFDMTFVHIFEAVIFPIAAFLLLLAAQKDKQVSDTAFRVDVWLALAIGLGGLRSALWSAGIEVLDANNVTFFVGVIAAPAIFLLLRRRDHRSSLR